MDFGKVSDKDLAAVKFKLPSDPKLTSEILQKAAKKKGKFTLHLGCAKWGRPEWLGKLYPKGTKAADFLDEYAKHYNAIELNATFYDYPDKKIVQGWIKKTKNENFIYCPKFTNTITHFRRLKNAGDVTDKFLTGISYFGKQLGPCFIQLHNNYGPKNFPDLEKYLKSLPKDLDYYIEVRHTEWFTDKQSRDLLFQLLKSLNKGWIITDAAGRRDCVHMNLPVPRAFIRFVGNSLHPTDYKRIDDWVNRIKKWKNEGLKELYFFMHMHNERYSPELSAYFIEQINKKCDLDLREIQLLKKE